MSHILPAAAVLSAICSCLMAGHWQEHHKALAVLLSLSANETTVLLGCCGLQILCMFSIM